MEEQKKCKLCGADAEWELDGGCYCEFCARLQLDVHGICAPQACATCNNPLGRVYYRDSEDNTFCSAKCALEYYDAKKLEEEQDDESGN